MTSAYDKIYLEKAQIVLGRMTDMLYMILNMQLMRYLIYLLKLAMPKDLKMGIIRCWLECQE